MVTAIQWIQIIAALTFPIGIIAIAAERMYQRKGIGKRTLQMLAIVFVLPAILILGLQGIISSEGTSALFGIIIGYVLSGIGDE